MRRFQKRKSFLALLAFSTIFLLGGCKKYVQPSPFDGIWEVISYEAMDPSISVPTVSAQRPEMWRFSNVLFQCNKSGQKQIQGYLLIERDNVTLRRLKNYEGTPWLEPDGSLSETLEFKYKVWKDELVFKNDRYKITMVKK